MKLLRKQLIKRKTKLITRVDNTNKIKEVITEILKKDMDIKFAKLKYGI